MGVIRAVAGLITWRRDAVVVASIPAQSNSIRERLMLSELQPSAECCPGWY